MIAALSLFLLLTDVVRADHADHAYHHAEFFTRETMPLARSDMTATVVGDGIYVIGGCAARQGHVSRTLYANITGQTNMSAADVLNWYEGYYCGTLQEPGATTRTSVYFPGTNSWTVLADAPRARYRHAAAAVGTSIYVFGGTDDTETVISEVDVYDTVAGTWSTLASTMTNSYRDLAGLYPTPIHHKPHRSAYNGNVYAVGGYNSTYASMDLIQEMQPSTGIFTTVGRLSTSRGDCGAVVSSTYAYVVGGFNAADFCSPLNTIDRIDLSSFAASESAIPPLAIGRGDKAVATLGGKLHVFGGESKTPLPECASNPLVDVEIYESEDALWRFGGDIPEHRFRVVAAAFGESSVYLIGGQSFLVGDLNADGSYFDVEHQVLEYREDVFVDDHDDDHHDQALGLGGAGLAFGLVGLCAGLAALALSLRARNEARGLNGCVPSSSKKAVVEMGV
eukprot:g3153.t1